MEQRKNSTTVTNACTSLRRQGERSRTQSLPGWLTLTPTHATGWPWQVSHEPYQLSVKLQANTTPLVNCGLPGTSSRVSLTGLEGRGVLLERTACSKGCTRGSLPLTHFVCVICTLFSMGEKLEPAEGNFCPCTTSPFSLCHLRKIADGGRLAAKEPNQPRCIMHVLGWKIIGLSSNRPASKKA